MSLVPSLFQAIVRVDGDALVMHPGDKPYVVAPTGQVELASRGLTLEAVNGIVAQLLPPELQLALEEFGAVQYELPAAAEFPGETFTLVAARGGDDVWMEIRRRRVPDDDRVPDDMFGPSTPPVESAPPNPPVMPPPVAAVAAMPPEAVPLMPPVNPAVFKPGAINPSATVAAPAVQQTNFVATPVATEDDDHDYVPVETLGFRDAPEEPRAEGVGGFEIDDDLLLPDATQLWPGHEESVEPVDDQGDVEVDVDIDVDADVDEETPPLSPPVWQKPPQIAPSAPVADVGPSQPVASMPSIIAALPSRPAAVLPSPPAAVLPSPPAVVVPPQPVAVLPPPLAVVVPPQPATVLPPPPAVVVPSQPRVVPAWQPIAVAPPQPVAVLPPPPDVLLPSQLRLETQRTVDKLKQDAGGLADTVRGQVDTLGVKKEFEAFDERMRTLQSGVGDAESRMEALTAKDKNLTELTQKVDGLSKRFEALFAQADDLTKKQLTLETLHERLGQVDDLAKKTTWQLDSLRQSHEDLDVLRQEIQEFTKTHADAATPAEKAGADHVGLEAFGERMTAFATLAPELEAKMDAITGKLKLVEDGTRKATRLHESVAELDAQISRVSARVPLVEKLEGRLNGLNALSGDVDRKLEDQLARRVELETLKAACDGLEAQMVDAQHKLDGVRALQTTFAPLVGEVTKLRAEIGAAEKRLQSAKFNEAALVEQEKRYAQLVAAGKTAASEVAERSRQMQALTEELARSAKMKDEMLVELDRVQGRQRETTNQIQASEDQLARAENMFKQLEARSQVVFAEKTPEEVLPSPPGVVLSIARTSIRPDQPPPGVPDPTLSGLERLLRVSSARGASTLYLSSESRPSVRVDGELQVLDGEPLHVARDVESLLLTLMPERSHEALRTGAATEWICDIEGVGRIRCMSFRDHRGPGGVFRLMPTRSVSVDQLGLPRQVQSLAMEPEGLVLVAGSRSSGKRTLMSAFVDLMNRTRRDHVITIEREINIVHERGNSFISQREVRGDDEDMLSAARAAMREDPDVLVIEDLHTGALMNVALEAAAAGRLVIGGFSAHTATGAIDRIIDLYAPEYRRQVQFALADSLRGVIVQVLLHKIGGGRLPAREVLLNTPAVSSAIAEGKTSQLPMAIEGGRRYGMMPLNDALVGLVQTGVVEGHEAYLRSADRPGFLAALNRQGIDTSFVEKLA